MVVLLFIRYWTTRIYPRSDTAVDHLLIMPWVSSNHRLPHVHQLYVQRKYANYLRKTYGHFWCSTVYTQHGTPTAVAH